MRHCERQPGRHDCGVWRDAARPEHGHFRLVDRDGLAPVWRTQLGRADAKGFGATPVDRRAVCACSQEAWLSALCVPHMRAEAVKKGQALPAEFSSYGAAAVAHTKQESQAWVYRDTGV